MTATTPRPGFAQARSFRVIVLLTVMVAALALALFFSGLLNRAAASHARQSKAAAAMTGIRAIDGIEWRAVAGVDMDEMTPALTDATAQVRQILAEGEGLEEVSVAFESFVADLHEEFGALSQGDWELANRIDRDRVDPGFDHVLDVATEAVDRETRSAARTEALVRRLIWLSLAATATLLGVVLTVVFTARDRMRAKDLAATQGRRFQSLVESSADVITVVSGSDALNVMSATLSGLGPFAASPRPTKVGELLPAEALEPWHVADEHLRATGTPRSLAVSLSRPDGSVAHFEAHGSLLVDSPDERVWVWRDVTERQHLERQLSHQAFHDPLTGLANRALFRDRTEHALGRGARSSLPTAVLFIDLDDFKTVNDSLGHAAGDELLNVIASRMRACMRPADTLARLGGDEFAVLLEDTDEPTTLALAQRLMNVVCYEVPLRERVVVPSLSIGVAVAEPGAGSEELLRNADLAMYAAKRAGKGRAEAFHAEMHQVSSDLLEMQADLKAAIDHGQLMLRYQPTVDLETGEIDGVEALIRWQHPTRGPISPATFIPVAEATGQIIPIGRWVLQEACRTAVQLQQGRTEPLIMHVNLSPQQLRDPSIVTQVSQTLTETCLDPNLLVLEVTEGFLLDDRTALARLHELKALGVRIAIDDFGTGYTSITYLQQLPIDILKIDRSFVSGDALELNQRKAFLHAIVGLAQSLNLHSVAEGIETAGQLHELAGLGCQAGQGYLWAPALSTEELLARLAERTVVHAA